MKNILFIAVLFSTFQLSAQIALVQSGYPASVIGTDSLKQTVSGSAFPVLAPQLGGSWDMSIVTDTTPVYFAYRVPTIVYQFADSNYYTLAGYAYQGNVQSSITSAGIYEYGINVLDTAYSISSITSGFTDSIFIPAQNADYSAPRLVVPFPAVYHSGWSSVYQFDINFQLSVALASLIHAPAIVRSYVTEKDSVVGWGQMRVNDITGSPSGYWNVLQVKSQITTTDSFFLDGSSTTPTLSFLLTDLGLTQGKQTTTYQQNYYRIGEVTPLAQVSFTDSTYAHPYKAVTHVQRLGTTGIGIINEAAVKLFPNPVTKGTISVELPYTTGSWAYEVTNTAGQTIATGSLQNNSTSIALPLSITAGTYYVRITNDNKQVIVKSIEVRK